MHALANPDRMQKGWSFGALNIEYTDGVKKGFRMRYGIGLSATEESRFLPTAARFT